VPAGGGKRAASKPQQAMVWSVRSAQAFAVLMEKRAERAGGRGHGVASGRVESAEADQGVVGADGAREGLATARRHADLGERSSRRHGR